MSETTTEQQTSATENAAPATTEQQPEQTPGSEHLGDAGKRALDTMKQERNTARDEAKTFKQQLEELQAKVDNREAEYQQQQHDRQVEQDALTKANQRILKAEVRAAATGKLADPTDALLYLNLSEFEVGSDGDVDADRIATAIEDLTKTKPYLAAQGKRFQGDADGGSRNEVPEKSIDQQIADAEANRDHLTAIALKQKRAAQKAK